jgi:phage shock protein A
VGIVGRLGSYLRSGLSAALAPAADPRETTLSAYQKQLRLLGTVHAAIEQVSAAKARLRAQSEAARRRLPQLLEQAREELRTGHREAARVVLERRQLAVAELATIETELAGIEKEEADLRVIEQRLTAEVEAFAARQEAILARYTAAEAQVRINEAVTGVSEEFAGLTDALQRTEEQTENLRARAAAIERLVGEGALEAPVALGPRAVDPDVDAQLAALQATLDP